MSSPAPRSVQRVLDRLDNVRRSGSGWLAKCPAHEDSQPSLTVGIGRDDRVLLTCHRGCDVKDVLVALDLGPQDLFAESKQESQRDELVATYDYVDAGGELVFQVLRFRQGDGRKTFRQRRPDGRGGWLWSLGDVERPLFRLPKVLDTVRSDGVVWVVEGEKDVLSLERQGLVATCNSGGAGKWLDNHTASLKDAKVVIVADNDEVGRTHATRIRAALTAAGARVKMGVPPDGHKDITDMLQAGLGVSDLLPLDPDSPGPTPTPPTPESPDPDGWADLLKRLRGYDPELPLEERVRLARLELGMLIPAQVANPGRIVPWVDFIDETTDDTYDWLIPGLIEREERVMIVAAEGVGKSVLARQVALLSGAGVHPFTYSVMDPIKTLFIDLENPERIIRRASRRMVSNLREMFDGRLRASADLWTKPDGLNVLKESDRALLEERLERLRPDLVVFGPLYKFYIDPGGRTAEAVAIEVATYLDFLRATFGCALWIEHHAPLGNALSGRELRPMGSAVWLRWPEFGYSLAQDPAAVAREYVVKQWRGPRDERSWPSRMVRGSVFPWEVVEWCSPGL